MLRVSVLDVRGQLVEQNDAFFEGAQGNSHRRTNAVIDVGEKAGGE